MNAPGAGPAIEDLPPIGLGTMGIDDPEAIRTAIDVGYSHLDTAQIYDNEAVVGDGLARALDDPESNATREDVFVATKVWADSLAPDDVARTARESADRLGVDVVDLLYVHRPIETYEAETTLPAFDELVADGLIGSVGVSNFTIEELDRAIDVLDADLAAHQTELHPLFYQPELLEHARRNDYAVVAYSPLASGRLGEIDAVVDVAEKHGTSPEAISLAWLMEKDPVIVIPKASSEAHLRANLAARDLELDRDDVAAIEGIDREEELFPE